MIDDRGRIAGRVNLIDALVAAIVIGLVPVGVATWFLFRTPPARITSVTEAPITREELRIAGGSYLAAKIKVRGTGLRPVLRAYIDSTPALGFVFESPTSADVVVGNMPPGAHDLILYDGVQEVARAPKSVVIAPLPAAIVRVVGILIDMDRPTAESLHEGAVYPDRDGAMTRIVRLGPIEPARRRFPVAVDGGYVDLPVEGLWERPAIAEIRCDADSSEDTCAIGGVSLRAPHSPDFAPVMNTGPFSIAWNHRLRMVASEILPNTAPHTMEVKVEVKGPAALLRQIAMNDRDDLIDEDRAARVSAVARDGDAALVTLTLGADVSRDGWRYRGRLLRPGEAFTLSAGRYVAAGTVVAVDDARGRQ